MIFFNNAGHQDSEDVAVTRAILSMGQTLSLTVVAEGVETEEQMTFLQEHACDEMQGFHFSVPVFSRSICRSFEKSSPLFKTILQVTGYELYFTIA
jgi:EAL domain-containing protein (putative c-di-GMP-specific phosphodiesterase class I)